MVNAVISKGADRKGEEKTMEGHSLYITVIKKFIDSLAALVPLNSFIIVIY